MTKRVRPDATADDEALWPGVTDEFEDAHVEMAGGYRIDPGPAYPRAARMVDGWCVRLGPGLREWLEDADGEAVRFATRTEAEQQIIDIRIATGVIMRGTISQLRDILDLEGGFDRTLGQTDRGERS